MEMNPYAPPQAQVLLAPSSVPDELIREEYIVTEAAIKSVGVLYYLGAFASIFVGGVLLLFSRMNGETVQMLFGVFLLGGGMIHGVIAYGLRGLQGWARIPTIILSCIGLIGFPVGTLISIYVLVKVTGKQGRFVLTPEYRQIIAATPHVKDKTSILARMLVALLLITVIGFVTVSLFG